MLSRSSDVGITVIQLTNWQSFWSKSPVSISYYCLDSFNLTHSKLCQWLWPKLLRWELEDLLSFAMVCACARVVGKLAHQGSSGCSRNDAFNLYQNYGIRSILSDWWYGLDMRVEEDAILEFVSAEFSERVELAYTTLEIEKLNMENLWVVFPTQEPACKSNGRSSI